MKFKKMKSLMLVAVCFMLCIVALPQDARAEGGEVYGWEDKLGRGFLNIISLPIEVARQIHLESNENNLLSGWTYGLIKGLGTGIVRTGAGVLEVVTTPFDWPDSNKAPIVDPEFAWDKPGVKYS